MKFNKLIPELAVADLGRSLEFYAKVLGFKVEYTRDESGFAFLSLQGNQIMIEQTWHRCAKTITLFLLSRKKTGTGKAIAWWATKSFWFKTTTAIY